MSQNQIEEEDDFFDLTNAEPPKDIFAFNEMRSCADLKRMCDNKQLDIAPDFQREQVWKMPEKAKFLDSLLKNLPIPSMCLGVDTDNVKRTVIDGLQRITTVVSFLSAAKLEIDDFRLPILSDIDARLSGNSVYQIAVDFPEVIAAIENAVIPITTLRYSSSNSLHNQYIFTIFHRLNTGGTKLTPQEIRNGIYGGYFNQFLRHAAEDYKNELCMLLSKKNSHFIYEEFLLRFFAFQEKSEHYQAPLVNFLNNYMFDKRKIDELTLQTQRQLLVETFQIVRNTLFNETYKKVVVEAILHGIGKNSAFLIDKDKQYVLACVEKMLQHPIFAEDQLRAAVAFKTNVVRERFQVACDAFSE